jgi:hypothetical protein
VKNETGETRGNKHVSAGALKEKSTYLMISFFDDDMFIPDVTTVIYLGKDIFGEGGSNHYFQDYETYMEAASPSAETGVIEAGEDSLMNFYDLDGAAALLAECAQLRRRKGRN